MQIAWMGYILTKNNMKRNNPGWKHNIQIEMIKIINSYQAVKHCVYLILAFINGKEPCGDFFSRTNLMC